MWLPIFFKSHVEGYNRAAEDECILKAPVPAICDSLFLWKEATLFKRICALELLLSSFLIIVMMMIDDELVAEWNILNLTSAACRYNVSYLLLARCDCYTDCSLFRLFIACFSIHYSRSNRLGPIRLRAYSIGMDGRTNSAGSNSPGTETRSQTGTLGKCHDHSRLGICTRGMGTTKRGQAWQRPGEGGTKERHIASSSRKRIREKRHIITAKPAIFQPNHRREM
jgi:hypothetical protein